MKFLVCALLALAVAPVILAEDENPSSLWDLIRVAPSPHIINGAEAKPHAFPHQVLLQIKVRPGVGSLCAGSLIHPQWVLTAAHCVNKVKEVIAVLGAHNMRNGREPSRQSIRVAQIFTHGNYEKQHTDIALLRLQSSARLNEFVQTIRLPAKSFKGRSFAGASAEICGWGRVTNPNGGISPVLRHARTKIISNQDCKKAGFGNGITNWRICSERTAGKGPCGGDSGGPMFITEKDKKRTIIGIVSFGTPACQAPSPSVYTRVDHWLDWIHSLTRIPIRN